MILGLSDNFEEEPEIVVAEENGEGLIVVSRPMFGKTENDGP